MAELRANLSKAPLRGLRRWVRGGLSLPLVAVACSSVAGQPAEAPPPPAPAGTTRAAAGEERSADQVEAQNVAPSGAEPQGAGQGAEAEAEAEEAEGPAACPEDMVLVEGDYCTLGEGGADDRNAVEHECIKEWYAPQNKKRVCEEFAPTAKCVGKKVKKRFCMDRYAWPNKKGERPEVMNRFYQAQVKCAAVGKRLCTESEWTFACEGPEMKPFPYGFKRDTDKCHGDVEWDSPNMKKVAQRDPHELARLWKGVRSGSQPECVSDFGVYDLPGNNDEVVSSETFESGWRGKYESVHTGGPWYKGVRNQCRPKIYTHDEGFYYYFLGFRCCSESEGAETDPRTPKQRKDDVPFSKVERLAGVGIDEMQKVLKKKEATGDCGCESTRCRTLCGTLLGPEAKDFEHPSKNENSSSGN